MDTIRSIKNLWKTIKWNHWYFFSGLYKKRSPSYLVVNVHPTLGNWNWSLRRQVDETLRDRGTSHELEGNPWKMGRAPYTGQRQWRPTVARYCDYDIKLKPETFFKYHVYLRNHQLSQEFETNLIIMFNFTRKKLDIKLEALNFIWLVWIYVNLQLWDLGSLAKGDIW